MKEKRSFAPVAIAIVLLLLPVLYVGSYLALVVPEGYAAPYRPGGVCPIYIVHYRLGYRVASPASTIFWPLEQIDRKVRPGAWQRPSGFLYDRRSLQIEKALGGAP